MDPVIDVIVPVYRGYEQTRRCLNSLLAAPQRTPFELIVIDDASPEPEIRRLLDDLAGSQRIHLLRNAENQGFVASVNAAMALHPERDLVLLNSDTEVANDWLDRLLAHARSKPCVATVTPLSNDATICSYPRIAETNPLPDDASVAELDALAAAVNAGQSIDIPTGVGFCLLIRRQVLNEIGLFDQQRFGRGYGEEVDFCLRAEQAGYRHLLAGDVFVYHQGGASFGAEAVQRKQQAQALIDASYPDYPERIQTFLARDVGRPLRRRLDCARLRRTEPLILFICHDRGGGVARHVRDLTKLLRGQAEVLRLQPHGPRVQRLSWSRPGEEFTLYIDLADGYAQAIRLLQALRIDRIHYHHVADLPPEVFNLPRDLGLAYDFTLHDFAAICPQFHCADGKGRYCGEPLRDPVSDQDRADCQRCLETRPPQWPLDIRQWRTLWHDWLSGAARIIAPSRDAGERLARHWPELPILHWPHPEPATARWGATPLTRQPLVKVLVLGAMSATKGLGLLEDCACDARQRELPLFFRVLGLSAPPEHSWPESPLSIAGSYQDDDLPDLIASERPDVFFFPSQVPETFSYTLTVAMHTGLPILATRIGAFTERLADYPAARLLDPSAPAADWNQALLCHQPQTVLSNTGIGPAQAADAWCADYAARYLEALRGAPAEPIPLAPLPLSADFDLPLPCIYLSSEDQPAERLLSHLYSAVVEYRDWRLQPELSRRIEQTELDLADAQWERRELKQQLCEAEAYALSHLNDERRAFTRHTDHLETRLAASEAQIIAIKNSTTWRLIQPLHDLIGTLRQPQLPVRLWRALIQRLGSKHRHSQNPGFAFPASEQPLVSLILGPIDDPAAVPACLQRLHAALQGLEFEVLLLEDAAGTLSAQLDAASISGLTLIPAVQPPHFGQHANQAAAQARGTYLLWLDPAIAIDRAAVEAMLEQLQQPDVGIVVPKIRTPDPCGCLVAAGGILWQDGSVWCDGAGDDPAKPEFNYLRRIDVAPWGCLVMARELFDSVEGFDSKSTGPHPAAVRISLKVQAKNRFAFYQPAVDALWVGGKSWLLGGQSVISGKQQSAVVDDWSTLTEDRPAAGDDLIRARDPSINYRVLVIGVADCPENGASIVAMLLDLIAKSDTKQVRFSVFVGQGEGRQEGFPPQEADIEVLASPFFNHVEDVLRQRGPWVDLFVFMKPALARRYGSLVRACSSTAKIACWPGSDQVLTDITRLRRLGGD